MNVAFLGLGTMGAPMARNLVEAGHAVAVYDVSSRAAKPWGRENEDWTAVLLLMEDLCRAEHLPALETAKESA